MAFFSVDQQGAFSLPPLHQCGFHPTDGRLLNHSLANVRHLGGHGAGQGPHVKGGGGGGGAGPAPWAPWRTR